MDTLYNLSVDIVIPVYNEGENIEKNLDVLNENIGANHIADFRITIIYDFDGDNTLPVIRNIRDKYVFPIFCVKNTKKGVVNAIKIGLVSSRCDYVLVTMADLSDDYSILPEMVKRASEGADVICASRYMTGGKLYGGPRFKQLISRTACLSIHYLSRIPTHDITNSYKLYSREFLERIQIESEGGFEIGMEITAKVFKQGGKIVEIPSQWWDRTNGESKFKLFGWIPRYITWYIYLLKK